jgi:hypothetical protein
MRYLAAPDITDGSEVMAMRTFSQLDATVGEYIPLVPEAAIHQAAGTPPAPPTAHPPGYRHG